MLKEGDSGLFKCIVKKKNQQLIPIETLGTEEMRILYSSGFTIGEKYVRMYTYDMYNMYSHYDIIKWRLSFPPNSSAPL